MGIPAGLGGIPGHQLVPVLCSWALNLSVPGGHILTVPISICPQPLVNGVVSDTIVVRNTIGNYPLPLTGIARHLSLL